MRRKRNNCIRPAAEVLESRRLLAVDAFAVDGTLFVCGDNGDNLIQVDQQQLTNTVNLTADGQSNSFDNIQKVVVQGGNGDDDISINTYDDAGFLISSQVFGGNGNDIIQGGGGSDYLDGGNGNDIVSNFVTDPNYAPIGRGSYDTLIGGNGNDSLWGGWGVQDVIFGGNGKDTIYDIVGGSNVIDGGRGDDFIIARAGAGLPTDPLNNPGGLTSDTVNANKDKATVLFDAGTQAGGAPVLIDGTLYVLNLDGGDISVNQSGKNVVVTYDGTDFTYRAKDVNAIAGIGGPTDDTFTNNTNIRSVFYGQGGNDTLLGGGSGDVLKGGSGNDYIDGRGGRDDITGDAGADVLVANSGKKDKDIVRTDAFDQVFIDLGLDRLVIKRNLAFA